MRPIIVLMSCVSVASASFCGDSSIPYSFEVLDDGQPVLGCARPTCFGWAPSGLPASHTASFYRINKKPDGFLRKERASIPPFQSGDVHYYHPQTAKCEESYGSTSCDEDDQWVGGVAPLLNVSNSPAALQCCTFEPLRLSVDRGVASLSPGQIVVGGEASKKGKQFAFDYISDVTKIMNNDGSVVYDVKLRRFPCLPLPIRNQAFSRVALQAPTLDNANPIALPNSIEGPFSEDHPGGAEPVTAQPVPTTPYVPERVTPYSPERVYYNPTPAPYAENRLWPTGMGQIDQYRAVQQPPQPALLQPYAQPQNLGQYPTVPQILPPPQMPLAPMAPAPQCCGPPAAYYPAAPGAGAYYCFSADTQVELIDGSRRRMDELQIEDWVQTIDEGKMVYSPVTLWLHRNSEKVATFRHFTLQDGRRLKITGKHYIFKTSCTANPAVPVEDVAWEAVFAESVEVGDCLYTERDETTMQKTKVVAIEEVRESGIYAPLTPNGKIMVNGVLASCHSVVQSNSLQQSFFSYVDAFFSISQWIFGNTSTNIRELPLGMELIMELLEQVVPKNLVTM